MRILKFKTIRSSREQGVCQCFTILLLTSHVPGVVQGGSRTLSDPFVVYGFPVSLQGKLKPVHNSTQMVGGSVRLPGAQDTECMVPHSAECF